MRVRIPSPLGSYTQGAREVDGQGATLAAVVADLDARFPGLRFRIIDEQDRIRPHIRFFINRDMVPALDAAVAEDDVVTITAALSGG